MSKVTDQRTPSRERLYSQSAALLTSQKNLGEKTADELEKEKELDASNAEKAKYEEYRQVLIDIDSKLPNSTNQTDPSTETLNKWKHAIEKSLKAYDEQVKSDEETKVNEAIRQIPTA